MTAGSLVGPGMSSEGMDLSGVRSGGSSYPDDARPLVNGTGSYFINTINVLERQTVDNWDCSRTFSTAVSTSQPTVSE